MAHAGDRNQPLDGRGRYTVVCAGNEPAMDLAYGDVCLVICVGKVGDRLAYRTVAQLKRAYQNSGRLAQLINRFEY